MKPRAAVLVLSGFALFAVLGYWLARSAAPQENTARKREETSPEPHARILPTEEPPVRFRTGERLLKSAGDEAAQNAGAIEGQRIILFSDDSALARFLARMGTNVRLLDRLDALRALRVGFDDPADLAALLEDETESFIFPVSAPPPPEGTVQPGAVALGDRLHDWLGITDDNSTWGRGVRIAVLDTGIDANSSLTGVVRRIELVAPPSKPGDLHGHGTAVASVIAGADPLTPGVAPAAELISVRVADDQGQSDSFLLARGIVEAVQAGADLINISMGSMGDSALVRRAVDLARERGVLIIAAAGNNGLNGVSYPAANAGVIAVGAVDALGNHLDFSNTGDQVAVAAPGLGLNAAWTGGQAASVTGTSFSAPVVTGSIAAVMTQAGSRQLTAAQAWEKLAATLNDAGQAGKDPLLGGGMPDLGRVLNASTQGIHDAALASNRILPPSTTHPFGEVEVLVQNRGTEPLINTTVEIAAGGNRTASNITLLAPNAVQTVKVPVTRPPSPQSGTLVVDSRVILTGGIKDAKPSNDRRQETYVPSNAP